nr:putative ribonuclease H-like domain-containing protein [Tanacetum cinerariifolium]
MVEEQSFMAIIHQKTDPALLQFCLYSCFLSQKVWTLVDCPKGVRPIKRKWVLKNKKDKRGIVVRNKARLVAQGHTQEEGIDYDEVFTPVARIKAIRLFLAYASFMGFTVYQMDVKSVFLYGTIDEEVYVMQPPGFHDPKYPARIYKIEKAMYGLHQAPRAWYEAMQEELLQFKIQNVWSLVDCPKEVRPIGTKWVLKNKKDERGIVIKNKAKLVAQGHTQEDRIDYDEVFAPIARYFIALREDTQ